MLRMDHITSEAVKEKSKSGAGLNSTGLQPF